MLQCDLVNFHVAADGSQEEDGKQAARTGYEQRGEKHKESPRTAGLLVSNRPVSTVGTFRNRKALKYLDCRRQKVAQADEHYDHIVGVFFLPGEPNDCQRAD